jgi:hypothetical protein
MSRTLVLSLLPAVVAWVTADAQPLASRVTRVDNGTVRMEVDSRPGTCGDGRETIGYRNALFARNFQSIGGRWNDSRCVPGPLRVTLTVENGQVTQMRTQVGPRWPSAEMVAGVTDFGSVPAVEASAYFFSLVPRLESASRKDRLLIPAVLADDAPVIQPLLALARDDNRALHTRQHAIQWLGLLGDATVLPTLMEFARGDAEDDKGLGSAALAALGSMDGAAGITAGQWLMARALDGRERLQLRKNALFWAGQREDTPTAELVRAYREAQQVALREHAIFVLSQRKDNAATEALLNIAREDKDTQMRGKALFWLAQNDDPRVRKLIADLILK